MSITLSETAERVLNQECPVLVTGGPGSGKTTLSLLKAQVLLESLKPGQEVLFLSFSRAAVHQVETRCLDVLSADARRQIAVRTYHAFALDILRTHGRLLTGFTPRILYPDAEILLKASFQGDWELEVQRLAHKEGQYTFSQFAEAAAILLSKMQPVASLIADKYPVIILDEFQDTDDSQWALVKALSESSATMFLADPDQRIFDYDPRVDPERLNHVRAHLDPVEFDLSGENHRSPDAGILQYANAILKSRRPIETEDVVTRHYRGNQFEATVQAGVTWMLSSLSQRGITQPSVVVLVRANLLIGRLSTAFGQHRLFNGQPVTPIEHDVLWDSDLTAAAALVVASILEWPTRTNSDAVALTFDRIADFFDTKNAIRASRSAQQTSVRYRTAADLARAGLRQRLKSAKALVVHCETGLELLGSPVEDWLFVRDLLSIGGDLRDVLTNAKYVRLFRATDDIGNELASTWDRLGNYTGAVDSVRRALNTSRIQSEQRDPKGCIIMSIHKAKGREFDGVLLVEGEYQGRFFSDEDTITDRTAMRRLLRVGITRARHQVAIIRPRNAHDFVTSGHK